MDSQQNIARFSEFTPESLLPRVEAALATAQAELEALLRIDVWSGAELLALDEMYNTLGLTWGVVTHLNAVSNTPELRAAYEPCEAKVSAFYTALGQNRRLYELLQAVQAGPVGAALDASAKRALELSLRGFRLSGIALEGAARERFAEISLRLSKLSNDFNSHVLDAGQAWTLHVQDLAEVPGLPASAIAGAAAVAKSRQLEGWVFTLDTPVYISVMNYCSSREVRRRFYEAFMTRASDQGPDAGRFDNSAIIDEMLALRQEMAELTGFPSYAHYSTFTKMAAEPAAVNEFLDRLATASLPKAREQVAAMQAFAAAKMGIDKLEPWDSPFVAERMRQELYSVNQEELRPYFPADVVLGGLFAILKTHFGVDVVKVPCDNIWHESVEFYEVRRSGALIARFYLDLYTRSGKKNGAWMNPVISRMRRADGSLQLPMCHLVCNFSPPVDGQPGLLTHSDVVTLFHEFGHGMHHLLTTEENLGTSGIGGVEWDAVELPSQFFENFCWREESMALLTSHYQTGETLPVDKLASLLAAKNFNAAVAQVRQLEFAITDIRLSLERAQPGFAGVNATAWAVRQRLKTLEPLAWTRFTHSFTHIFSGGYTAGYYSYKWAEVLSADAFGYFDEQGVLNPAAGRHFLEQILSKGGSASAAELFRRYRGRAPSQDALLRDTGISA